MEWRVLISGTPYFEGVTWRKHRAKMYVHYYHFHVFVIFLQKSGKAYFVVFPKKSLFLASSPGLVTFWNNLIKEPTRRAKNELSCY
jgi:hypothetical protein